MTGVRFLFRVTLRRYDLASEIWHIKEPQKLPPVLSPEEVKRVLTMATSLKARAMLSLAYGCGLRASEVARLRVCDIDSDQMIIRVVQSKGRKDRNVMLPPEILDLLLALFGRRPAERAERAVSPASKNLHNRGHASLDQLKVMSAIERCRTAAPNLDDLGPRRTLREPGVRPYARRIQLVSYGHFQ